MKNKNIISKDHLSTKIIYLLPFILLVPTQAAKATWWPLPNSGPNIFMFLASIVLLMLYLYEYLKDNRLIKLNLTQKLFFLWFVHTFISIALVILGFRGSLDSIGSRIYTAIPPYFLAFMVFLVIEKNKWKLCNFEKLAKALLIVCAVWSLESILTFYLNIQIPGLVSIARGDSWFSSGFTLSLHTISKASLIIFWLSMYMFFRHEKPYYILFIIGSFLTVIASVNRASIAMLIFSVIVFLYFNYIRYPERVSEEKNSFSFNNLLKSLLGLMAAISIILGGVFVNTFKGSLLADSHGFIERTFQYVRASEVIINYPLGAGAGLGYQLCYSEDVPQIYSDELRNIEPFFTFSQIYLSGILGANLQQKSVGEEPIYSIHNFSLNIIMDYGVFGFAILVAYVIWLFKYLKFVKLLYYSGYHKLVKTFACLVLAQMSVFIAMQATYKFFAWMWLLVYLFLFARQIVRGSIKEQKDQVDSNNGVHIPLSEINILGKI